MFSSPRQAYDQAQKTSVSGRQIDATALFKSARLLEECQQRWTAPDRGTRLRDALRRNQYLWTIFQTELAQPDHGLPPELRRDLLRLSAFVDRRTFEVMAAPSPEKLTALIEINRHVASGLVEAPAPA